jgi:hypothetical protein
MCVHKADCNRFVVENGARGGWVEGWGGVYNGEGGEGGGVSQ